MDIGAHFAYFAKEGLDPVVFLRIVRVLFLIAAALFMLKEPMQCGGKNQGFHRALAVLFGVMAWYSWTTANARMDILMNNPPARAAILSISFLLVEVVYTTVVVAISGKLGRDYYEYKEARKLIGVAARKRCNHECKDSFLTAH